MLAALHIAHHGFEVFRSHPHVVALARNHVRIGEWYTSCRLPRPHITSITIHRYPQLHASEWILRIYQCHHIVTRGVMR